MRVVIAFAFFHASRIAAAAAPGPEDPWRGERHDAARDRNASDARRPGSY